MADDARPGPFDLTLYDRAFVKYGTVGAAQALSFTPRHNQQPTGQIVVSTTHPRLADLLKKGCRYVLNYQGAFMSSGRVTSWVASGTSRTALYTFQLEDDWALFKDTLGWPDPASPVSDQTASEYDTRTGPAESVLKGIVAANLGHLVNGADITVAPDLGRGSTITVQNRFHPITDRTMPLVDGAGIGTTVRQEGAGLVVDCYGVITYPRALTEEAGVVREWSGSSADAKATRVVVGGQGEGTARVFRLRVNADAEADCGYTVEQLRDATDVTTDTELDQRGDDFLVENGPTSGLSVKLSETAAFRYDPTGVNGIRVGDLVTLQVGATPVVTDVLREVTVSWSVDQGLTVTPQVGERSNDPTQTLARAVRTLARGLRTLIAGR